MADAPATPRFRPDEFADYAWQNALCDRQGNPFDGERRAYNEAVCAWDAACVASRAPSPPVAAPAEPEIPNSVFSQQFTNFLDGNGPAPTEDGWPKLERPAALHANGGATFGKGVSSRLLVLAAYRNYERTEENRRKTPEQRVEARRRRQGDPNAGAGAATRHKARRHRLPGTAGRPRLACCAARILHCTNHRRTNGIVGAPWPVDAPANGPESPAGSPSL